MMSDHYDWNTQHDLPPANFSAYVDRYLDGRKDTCIQPDRRPMTPVRYGKIMLAMYAVVVATVAFFPRINLFQNDVEHPPLEGANSIWFFALIAVAAAAVWDGRTETRPMR